MKKQDFTVLKIEDFRPFPDNPFRLVEDELLMELSESIKEFGVVTPIITRPKEDGNGYEVIAGQRRVRASQLAGIETIPAFVLPLDRDRAIITLVDSNIQRENILPSERAFAYKMKLEAIKHQGERSDLTSRQVGEKSQTSIQLVANQAGESQRQVQRYIRLGVISMVFALLGVAVLITYSPQNGIILMILAFLISPFGLPKAAIWLLGKVQDLKYSIQDKVYE